MKKPSLELKRSLACAGVIAIVISIQAPQVAFSQFPAPSQKEASTPQKAVSSQPKTVTIPVEGMTCLSCVAGIKKALNSTIGVQNIEVSLKDRNARVTYYEEKISPDLIARKIGDLGYKTGQWKSEALK